MHQPFLTAFSVGAEYDYSKIKEISGNYSSLLPVNSKSAEGSKQFLGHLDIPIPGVNELFDFDGRLMVKG